jgi:hypothetical protein
MAFEIQDPVLEVDHTLQENVRRLAQAYDPERLFWVLALGATLVPMVTMTSW